MGEFQHPWAAPDTPMPSRSLSAGMIAEAFAATLEPGDLVHSAGGRVWAEVHCGERTVTVCEGLQPRHAERFAAMIVTALGEPQGDG